MTSSKCLCRRAGVFGSGSRWALGFSALAAASAFAFAARSAFSAFSGRGALSALSVFSGLAPLSCLSAIDLNSRPLGESDLLVAHDLEADAGRLAVLRIGNRQIRKVHRRLLRHDAAFLRRRLLLVALDHVD